MHKKNESTQGYFHAKYIQGQIRAHFSRVSGVGMRRLRAVVTFYLVSAKQIQFIFAVFAHFVVN